MTGHDHVIFHRSIYPLLVLSTPSSLRYFGQSSLALSIDLPAYASPTETLANAVRSGNCALAGRAIRNGDSVNAFYPDNGLLLLITAVRRQDRQMVELLLLYGANPYLGDCDGHTALHYATDATHTEVLRTLLERVPPDVLCANGHTPLHRAIGQGHAQAAALLIRHGANPRFPDHGGVTPQQVADQHGDPGLVALFQARQQSDARHSGPPPSGLGAGLQRNLERLQSERLQQNPNPPRK